MTTKEWLSRARRIDKEVAALKRAQQNAFDQCVSITTHMRETVISSTSDPHAKPEAWIALGDMLDNKLQELAETKAEILMAIWMVDNATYRTLLEERYINGQTWEQIAVNMNYCYRHVVKELHPRALSAVHIPKIS